VNAEELLPVVGNHPLSTEDLRRLRDASPNRRVGVLVRRERRRLPTEPARLGRDLARAATGFDRGLAAVEYWLSADEGDDLLFEISGDPSLFLEHEPEIVVWEFLERFRRNRPATVFPEDFRLGERNFHEVARRPGFDLASLLRHWLGTTLDDTRTVEDMIDAAGAIVDFGSLLGDHDD
jgi:hypothetical protein